jgi:hypothetical protein
VAWEVPSDFSYRARRVGSRGGIVSRRLADYPPPPIHPLGTRENHTLGIAFRGTGVKPDRIDSNLAPMGRNSWLLGANLKVVLALRKSLFEKQSAANCAAQIGAAQIGARHPVRRQVGC